MAISALSDVKGWHNQFFHLVNYIFNDRFISIKRISDIDILFFGAAENDKKRFHFLKSALNRSLLEFCAVEYEAVDFTPVRVSTSVFVAHSYVMAHAFALLRLKHGPIDAVLFQRVRVYFSSFFSCLGALAGAGRDRGLTVVVANDHSPAQVGCTAAARALGLPVIYVQHAPVTDYFPPLDFALSVLFNEKTVGTYRSAGPVLGDVALTTEFHERCDTQRLGRDLVAPVRVGVFLPAHPNLDRCYEVIETLERNRDISAVVVKPHPSVDNEFKVLPSGKITWLSRVAVNQEIAGGIDVAVLCNSGVALELMHEGVPCFYVHDLDAFGFDLYGLVGDGLVHERSRDALEGAFWHRSDGEMRRSLHTMALYDPTVDHEPDKLFADLKRKLLAVIAPSGLSRDAS